MKVLFLGTGTSQGIPVIGCDCDVCTSKDPLDTRLRCSVLVTLDNGKKVVVDIGPDFRYQMLRAKVDDLAAVLLTHEHNDHIAGLDDVRPFNFKHNRHIPLYLPERLVQLVQNRFDYVFSKNSYPGAPRIVLRPISKHENFEIEGCTVVPIEVIHGELPILGFRFGAFTYITDAKTIAPTELDKIRGTKILVLNALQHKAHWTHLNIQEALAIIEEIRPETAYLTHFSHVLGKHADVSRTLPPNVFMAYDGLEITLSKR